MQGTIKGVSHADPISTVSSNYFCLYLMVSSITQLDPDFQTSSVYWVLSSSKYLCVNFTRRVALCWALWKTQPELWVLSAWKSAHSSYSRTMYSLHFAHFQAYAIDVLDSITLTFRDWACPRGLHSYWAPVNYTLLWQWFDIHIVFIAIQAPCGPQPMFFIFQSCFVGCLFWMSKVPP